MIFQNDFYKFVMNYDDYMGAPFEFYSDPDFPDIPCAHLNDITIHFTHYKNQTEATNKWNERALRVDKDNMFVCCFERDGLTVQQIRELGNLKVKGLVVFTAHYYPDIPYACYLPYCKDKGYVYNFDTVNHVTGKRNYEKYFDIVKWLNEANGAPYDVAQFAK